MRKFFGLLSLVLTPVAGYAAENSLSWAYPTEPAPGANADAAAPATPVNQALIATTYTGFRACPTSLPGGSRCHACNVTWPMAARIPNRLLFQA